MRKFAVFLAVLPAVLVTVFANDIITDDFYLYNREHATFRECVKILPNTLRLELYEGESETISAAVVPDTKNLSALSWTLLENSGAIEIYPMGESCTVYARAEGEDSVNISLSGEGEVAVSVSVRPSRPPRLRSFESEERNAPPTRFTDKVLGRIIRTMVSFALVLLSGVAWWLIKQKKEKEHNGK